jgi:hypothetical protein
MPLEKAAWGDPLREFSPTRSGMQWLVNIGAQTG